MTHFEKLGEPDIKHDITTQFNKKMDAILAHKSQALSWVKSTTRK